MYEIEFIFAVRRVRKRISVLVLYSGWVRAHNARQFNNKIRSLIELYYLYNESLNYILMYTFRFTE